MVTIQEQKLLETNMAEAGVSRFRHTLNKMKEKGLESATKHGRVIITTHLEPVAEGIREIQNTSSNAKVSWVSCLKIVQSTRNKCCVLLFGRGHWIS